MLDRTGSTRTLPDGGEIAPWRNYYGRRRGRKLRATQAECLKALLARLEPPAIGWEENPERRPLDPSRLWPGKEVWLEIGFGSGEHMLAEAERHPDVQIIGAEPFLNGVAKLLAGIEKSAISNISVTRHDARDLMDVLPEASIGRVFLLYPDPWPKPRHHKRRFINRAQLDQLARIMRRGAELRIATDMPVYTRHVLEMMARDSRFEWAAAGAADWREPWPGWSGTRYEAKALEQGRRPYYLTFQRA